MPDSSRLVTGGAGFIGSNLADRLLRDGHTITILDNLSRPGAGGNLAWLRERHGEGFLFLQGDVRDFAAVAGAMSGVEVVYHLAGQTAVTASVEDPRTDFESNAAGTLNVLEAARLTGDDPVVLFASTNKVYGTLNDVRVVERATRYTFADLPGGVAEDQPLDLHSPYGCSKGAAEQYVRDYHRIYGLRSVVFRQSCIYGPRQLGNEEQGWVAWFFMAAAKSRPITIFGDGKQVRDLLYIDDLLDAYEAALEHLDRTAGQIYNVGGGPANTLSVWIELEPLIRATVGRPLPLARFAPPRPGDQRVFFCDTAKARADFGWQPATGLSDGLPRLAEWIASANHAEGVGGWLP